MKSVLFLVVSTAALTLAGCKNSENTADTATPPADALNTATAVSPPAAISPSQAFADAAAASDAFEIATSKLAETQAQSAKVKTFAAQMIKAHTDSTAKLKIAAGNAAPAIIPDPMLQPAQQQTLTVLQGKTGTDFDTAYAKAQVDGHQKTLDVLKAYAATGDVPSLKTFAGEYVPTVAAHLKMAKTLP